MAEQLVRCGICQHCRSVLPQFFNAGFADGRIGLLFEDLVRQFQFRHVNECVRITGKHAAAGSTVHASLSALCPLAVVVAVDHRTAQLGAHLVELVAEMGHLVGTVLVAGDDLVNGVDDDGDVLLFLGSPDKLRGKPVHRFRHAAEIPDVNAPEIRRRQFHCLIHVPKPVQAARPIQFQIDVQHTPPGTLPAQPLPPLGNGNGHLNEGIGLSGFGRSGNEHLVSLPQHVLDQRRRQLRHMLPRLRHALELRQIIGNAVDVVFPFRPRTQSDVGRHQKLLFAVPQDTRHTGEPGRIPVLAVYLQAVLVADLVEEVHPFPVFFVVGSVHTHNGVEALAAGVHQTRNGQLHFVENAVLPLHVQHVRFHQCIAVFRDVLVFAALAVQGIEPDPRSGFFDVVPDYRPDVAATLAQCLQQLSGGAVAAARCGQILAVLVLPRFRHIAHEIFCFKQGFDVPGKLLCRIPRLRLRNGNILCLFPAGDHIVLPDVIVPAEGSGFFRGTLGTIAVFQCHVYNCSGSDRVL